MKLTEGRAAKGTRFETPYLIGKGRQPGAALMITAGVHGNEPAAVRAAREWVDMLRRGQVRIDKGLLIVVPLANQEAFGSKTRGLPDLNRTFPRRRIGVASHPLSTDLFRLAKRYGVGWYIDMHEANGLSALNPRVLGQTLIVNPGSRALPALRRVAAAMNRSIPRRIRHFDVRIRELPGSGRHAAYHLLRAQAVTVETCWSLPIRDRIAYHLEILRMLGIEAGLITRTEIK